MPETPEVGFITRYLFESAWIPATLLAVAAVSIAWFGVRDGVRQRLLTAVILGGLAAVIIATGSLVTTSGEHAARVVGQFVDDVVGGNLTGAMNAVAPDGGISIGSPNNPRFNSDLLRDRLAWQGRKYPIESNTVTNFDHYTIDADTGEVRLACYTEVLGAMGPTLTSWIITVERQPDGTWMIDQLTWISVNNQAAREDMMR